jgi:predicted ATPase
MEDCDAELKNLNVLIGANGAGKSAFIELFNMLNCLFDGELQEYVSSHGGPDELLRFGRLVTPQIELGLFFGKKRYRAVLRPSDDGRLCFAEERVGSGDDGYLDIGSGHFETRVREHAPEIASVNCQAFHIIAVGPGSLIRQPHPIEPCEKLLFDGSNLAPYLYALKENHYADYARIVKRMRVIAPFFDDFYLAPDDGEPEMIRLRWRETGCDVPLGPGTLSDGMIRFACILSIFRYPKKLRPDILLIDEPALSLHPRAVEFLYHIIKVVSEYQQVIVSTQSTELLNKFKADAVLVVDRTGGKTSFTRLDEDELEEWLANVSIKELWASSIIGGQPTL